MWAKIPPFSDEEKYSKCPDPTFPPPCFGIRYPVYIFTNGDERASHLRNLQYVDLIYLDQSLSPTTRCMRLGSFVLFQLVPRRAGLPGVLNRI
jgi:hypothetical protein